MRSIFANPGRTGPLRTLSGVAIVLPVLACASLGGAADAKAPAPSYELTGHIGLGAGARWDYITVDSAAHRAYVAHADRVEVVDTRSRTRLGTITGLHGTHGIAVADALGRGFISDGKGNAVVIFDLQSLAVLRTVAVGRNPDAIVYDSLTRRVATFNGASHDATILDAASGDVLALSVPMGGKPEFARVDAAGHVFINIEDTAEIVDLDLQKAAVRTRYSIAPCEEPTGLAQGSAGELVSVCQNHLAIISDPSSGKVLAKVEIGEGPDGVVVDDGYAYSANGGDGSISVLLLAAGHGATAVGAIASHRSARTIDVDPATHALYLPSLTPGAAAPTAKPGATSSPSPAADTNDLEILVFTRK